MKSVIQFSHANGFPAPVYAQFLTILQQEYELKYITRIGHNPKYPITDNWPYLVDELIDSIDKPVYGLGHSLGGMLTFFAALKRPDLFKGIILLDAPLMVWWRAFLFGCLKKLGLHNMVSPGPNANKRRRHWVSKEKAVTYFKSKAVFKLFDQQCLDDYVSYGTVESKEGRSLFFDPLIESEIYATLPYKYVNWKKKLSVPSYFIYGKRSTIVTAADLSSIRSHSGFKIMEIEGTHLFPFENPKNSAQLVLAALAELDILNNLKKE
jgi:pimeloyl-ACP methyl ester carboxylesterase